MGNTFPACFAGNDAAESLFWQAWGDSAAEAGGLVGVWVYGRSSLLLSQRISTFYVCLAYATTLYYPWHRWVCHLAGPCRYLKPVGHAPPEKELEAAAPAGLSGGCFCDAACHDGYRCQHAHLCARSRRIAAVDFLFCALVAFVGGAPAVGASGCTGYQGETAVSSRQGRVNEQTNILSAKIEPERFNS